jgi:signal transduction histidine kinase/ActR/RegA family two-component response regulator
MTGPIWRLVPILAGLLLVLTYLLVRGASPDPVLHERILQALHALTLNDAALQRDILRARAGLLPNYDPLVQARRGVREAIDTLRVAGDGPYGGSSAGIERHLGDLVAEAAEQEALVETFKSDNALLQNSLAYFTHASQELGRRQSVAAEVGSLVNAMLQFMRDPQEEVAAEVAAALDRLAGLPAPQALEADVQTLVAHGRLILNALPDVDAILGRVLNAQTAERARALQDAYLDYHAGIEARAKIFRVLLYLTSVLLLAYLGYLFLRLRANARALAERSGALQERVTFESLVTGVSAHFINLSPDRVDHGINQALARLGDYTGVDRAYILLFGADGRSLDRSHAWHRAGIQTPVGCRGDLPVAESLSSLERFVQQGSMHVPSVCALPATPEKTSLAERGVRSWLCLPMWCAGKRVGLLGFDAMQAEKRWSDDDIALLRTVGEIFANALERKRAEAEREALEAQLRQSQRMEAIGTLAGGIAHNFNNVLGAILGYGEMALAALPAHSRPRRYVQQVMTAGERGKGVVDQILAFSHRGEYERRPTRMQPVVGEAVDLLRASLPTTIAIRTRLEVENATVLGDPTQLQQVVVNLATNAAQAMDGNGTLEVALDAVEPAGDLALSHGTLVAGRYVRLTVSDAGRGMDDATVERIFEPFFTTKAAGSGTGLGLSSVHGIVADHGGAINVRSRPGEGSVFEVYLARTEAFAASDDQAKAPAPCGRGETVLLLDDETPLVLLGEEMLAALGYEPVGFDSSSKALAAVRADPGRFDLVLTDEVMPGMTGTQLAVTLHRIRPELPIILMTGHSGQPQSHRLRAAGICEVLRKPLSSADIASGLARHLVRRRRDYDR